MKTSKSFTLIELLVVIAIIGLLATIVMISVGSVLIDTRTAKRIADLTAVRDALEMFYIDNGYYPNSFGGAGVWDGIYSCWGDSIDPWIPALVPNYLAKMPRDPRNHTVCSEQYIYKGNGGDAYKLISHSPEDCAGVKAKYPNLIDPVRDCWAFGYWSVAGAGY